MGCTSCGTGSGSGGGCGGNCGSGGGCKSGKLEVTDWLANMDLPYGQKPYELVEVRFKNGRKHLFRNTKELSLNPGDTIVVDAVTGYDVGIISLTGELVKIQQEKKHPGSNLSEFGKIHRIATQEDIDKWKEGQAREKDLMYESRKLATSLGLEMKISDVEYQGDLSKATFYYTAEGRVDFRLLIKKMAEAFKVKIEMRQIGVRQEAARLGGISSSGRELCCATWLTDFRSVSTSAARYQQLSLNPQKLAGQCGKLKCCLNFELDMYIEGLKEFPSPNIKLKTEAGDASHIKTDIFKKVMWYAVSGSSSLIGLSPDAVREIASLNKKGELIKDLREYESDTVSTSKGVVEKVGFVSLDDDESFDRLVKTLSEKPSRNKSKRRKPSNKNSQGERNQKAPVEKKREEKPRREDQPKGANNVNKPREEGVNAPKSNRPPRKKKRNNPNPNQNNDKKA